MIKTLFTLLILIANAVSASAKPPEPRFAVKHEITPAAAKGTASMLRVAFHPEDPWVLKKTTPLTMKLSSSPQLSIAQNEFKNAHLNKSDETGVMYLETSVTPSTAGPHQIEADAVFFLCTPEICQRLKWSKTWSLDAR